MLLIILFSILVLTSNVYGFAPQPPVWAQAFSQSYSQSYPTTTTFVSGQLFYDSKKGMMRIDRSDGQFDMFCNSVFPGVSTPCMQLIRDKKKYIVFPQKRNCCFCCDQKHGCGVPPPNFMINSTYEGYQSLAGQSFYKWSFKTQQATNYYYETISQQRVPRRFVNSNHTVDDFLVYTYSTNYIQQAIFALPTYCNTTCPKASICGKIQPEHD